MTSGESQLSESQQSFYQAVFNRRDVRSEFLPDAVPADVLARLLTAAHHAPSVGLSQPWRFVLIQDVEKKREMHRAFESANAEAAEHFSGERRAHYRSLKLQGILEAPLNLCVVCDRGDPDQVVLGKTHQPKMDLYSVVCAVQNMWLAARAEDIGIGWVSIIEPEKLRNILKLQENVEPVAYLCLGYVQRFRQNPELEEEGWAERMALESLVYSEEWDKPLDDHALRDALRACEDWPRQLRI